MSRGRVCWRPREGAGAGATHPPSFEMGECERRARGEGASVLRRDHGQEPGTRLPNTPPHASSPARGPGGGVGLWCLGLVMCEGHPTRRLQFIGRLLSNRLRGALVHEPKQLETPNNEEGYIIRTLENCAWTWVPYVWPGRAYKDKTREAQTSKAPCVLMMVSSSSPRVLEAHVSRIARTSGRKFGGRSAASLCE